MKTIKLYLQLLAGIILIASCGNQQVKMRTTINTDGTCVREVSYENKMTKAKRDSLWKGNQPHWSYPIPDFLCVDSLKDGQTDIKGDTVITRFRQEYGSVEEMSAHTPLRLGSVPLKSVAHLEKHFYFFYTEYVFSETFKSLRDKYLIQPEKYADPKTIQYWFTGEPNLLKGMNGAEASSKLKEIEPLVTNWINDNIASVAFHFIAQNYDSIVNPPLSKEEFLSRKDSLIKFYINKGEDALITTDKTFASFFHSEAYAPFFDEDSPLGAALSELIIEQIQPFTLNIPYTLKMPGTIYGATGGAYITNNIITFYLTGERLIPQDYTLTATSRVTNIWAYILTALVILLAIGSFWLKRKA